jgi:hypothetical protein
MSTALRRRLLAPQLAMRLQRRLRRDGTAAEARVAREARGTALERSASVQASET